MHTGTINVAGLQRLYQYKLRFLASLKSVISACDTSITTTATPDVDVEYFSELSFETVSGLCFDGTISTRRQRFWLRPPRLLLLSSQNYVYDTWYPRRKIFKITFLRTVGTSEKTSKFFFGKRGSTLLCVKDFAYTNLAEFREVCLAHKHASSSFRVYDLRTKKAARRTSVRLPMTSVKSEYRNLLYMSVYRLSNARFVASNQMQQHISRLGSIADPQERAFQFTRDIYHEKGRDVYQESYTAEGLVNRGDRSALRSLCKRDGSNLLEHIQRSFVKSVSHILSIMLQVDLKSNRRCFECAIMKSNSGGLGTYISSTIKALHKARRIVHSFNGQKLSSENRDMTNQMIRSLVLNTCGKKRFEKNLFDKPDAVACVLLCRKISSLVSSFIEGGIDSIDVSIAPIAKGWCHGHFDRTSLNWLIRSSDYEMSEIENIEDILMDAKFVKKMSKKTVHHGVTSIRCPGREFQCDGSSVVFAYDTSMEVEMECVATSDDVDDTVVTAEPLLRLNNKLRIIKTKSDLLRRDVTDRLRWKKLKERLERTSERKITSFNDVLENYIVVISDPGNRDCRCMSVLVRYTDVRSVRARSERISIVSYVITQITTISLTHITRKALKNQHSNITKYLTRASYSNTGTVRSYC